MIFWKRLQGFFLEDGWTCSREGLMTLALEAVASSMGGVQYVLDEVIHVEG